MPLAGETMAKVWRFNRLGGPEVLQLDDIALPKLGKNDVHIKVKAIGLNRSDLNFRQNQYIQKPTFPSRFGYEASGIIEATGENVTEFKPGDSVFLLPVDNLSEKGVCADEVIIDKALVVLLPKNLSYEAGAAAWMQYLTAWGGVIDAARPQKGDFVLITAASSSVGIAAIQLVRQIGAIPIATTLGLETKQAIIDAGAEYVIATDAENLSERLRQITGTTGLASAFDAVGGEQVSQIAEVLSKFGRLVIHGHLSNEATPYPLKLAIRNSLTIKGYLFAEILNDAVLKQKACTHIIKGLSDGVLIPVIDRIFRFEDMREAQEYMLNNRRLGKVILTV